MLTRGQVPQVPFTIVGDADHEYLPEIVDQLINIDWQIIHFVSFLPSDRSASQHTGVSGDADEYGGILSELFCWSVDQYRLIDYRFCQLGSQYLYGAHM